MAGRVVLETTGNGAPFSCPRMHSLYNGQTLVVILGGFVHLHRCPNPRLAGIAQVE
jgi:hypothetical protein